MIEICRRNSKFDNSEDNWYMFLDQMISYTALLDYNDPKQA